MSVGNDDDDNDDDDDHFNGDNYNDDVNIVDQSDLSI